MTLPEWLRGVLPAQTQDAWERVREVLPAEAYLVGGTGLAVHLRHRQSRDLDFFLSAPVDLDALEARMRKVGKLAVTWRDTQTLNGVLDGAKVQFLEPTRVIEPTTKLNVVVRRPEARDCFDLLVVEQEAHRYVEEGLALFVERYRPTSPDQAVSAWSATGSAECPAHRPPRPPRPELIPPGHTGGGRRGRLGGGGGGRGRSRPARWQPVSPGQPTRRWSAPTAS